MVYDSKRALAKYIQHNNPERIANYISVCTYTYTWTRARAHIKAKD